MGLAGGDIRGRSQSDDVWITNTLTYLKLIHLCPSPPAPEKAGDCWKHRSCGYCYGLWRFAWGEEPTVHNSPPNRLQSTSPSFSTLPSHYFIYQMPISLRRVREYFEEIVNCLCCNFCRVLLSINTNKYYTLETSISRPVMTILKDLCSVVVVGGGGSSFWRSPERLCFGATYH